MRQTARPQGRAVFCEDYEISKQDRRIRALKAQIDEAFSHSESLHADALNEAKSKSG